MTADPEHAHPATTITKPQKDHLPVHINTLEAQRQEVQTGYN